MQSLFGNMLLARRMGRTVKPGLLEVTDSVVASWWRPGRLEVNPDRCQHPVAAGVAAEFPFCCRLLGECRAGLHP